MNLPAGHFLERDPGGLTPARRVSSSDRLVAYVITGGVLVAVVAAIATGSPQLAVAVAATLLVVPLVFVSFANAVRALFFVYVLLLPFAVSLSWLRPGAINYSAVLGGMAVLAASIAAVRAQRVHVDAAVIFLVFVPMSSLVAFGPTDFVRTYTWVVAPVTGLALYYITVTAKQRTGFIIKAIIGLAVVEAALGVCQSLLGRPLFSAVLARFAESNRGYLGYILPGFSTHVRHGSGTFPHFNALSALLALTLPLAFGLYRANRSAGRLVLLIIIAAGLFTTYSRGALIGAAAGCLIIWALEAPRRRRAGVSLAVAVSLALAVVGAHGLSRYQAETGQLAARTATWEYAFSTAARNPSSMVFGYGYRYFQADVLETASQQGLLPRSVQRSIHSGPLQVLLETGIVGLSLFLLATVGTVVRALTRRRDMVKVTLAASILAFLIAEMFDNALFGFVGTLMFVLLAVLKRTETVRDPSLADLWALPPTPPPPASASADENPV